MAEQRTQLDRTTPGKASQLLMVRVRANLSREGDMDTLYGWLDRWRDSMTKCSRSGGVWDERFEVILPSDAVDELPRSLVSSVASPLPV